METSAYTPSPDKRGELSQLIGETIISYRLENEQVLRIACDSGRVFHVSLADDGAGGNDSHAYFGNVVLHKDRKITLVREEERSSYGARFAVETATGGTYFDAQVTILGTEIP